MLVDQHSDVMDEKEERVRSGLAAKHQGEVDAAARQKVALDLLEARVGKVKLATYAACLERGGEVNKFMCDLYVRQQGVGEVIKWDEFDD